MVIKAYLLEAYTIGKLHISDTKKKKKKNQAYQNNRDWLEHNNTQLITQY